MDIDVATRGIIKLALFPPGLLILLMLIGWLFARRWLGRLLLLTAIGLFYLLSTPAGVAWLAERVETVPALSESQVRDSGADAIWVLLAGIDSVAPERAGGAWLEPFSLQRLDYALTLHRQTGLPIALSGGSPSGDAPAVGQVAADWLRQQAQVEPRLVEAASRDTWENARESARLFSEQGIGRVLLVTHAFHMPRALVSAEMAGIDATPAPCCFEHTPPAWRRPGEPGDWLPTPGALGRSYLMLHEMAGIVWYRLFRASD